MITLMMLLLASGAMAPDDDDDAETKALKKFAQFQFDRMQDEFSFYINPKSAVELVGGNLFPGSPYIINVINAVINTGAEVLYQMTGNYEKLESNKPLKYWLKSVPVLNQFVLYYTLFEPDIAKDLGVKPFTIRKL